MIPRNVTAFETAIGAVFLLALLSIGAGVTAAEDPAFLLPRPGELPGWGLSGQVLSYPAEDLWKHINGAAEQYLSYGCESLTVGYYKKEESETEITVEIYKMKDPLHGFGIYTAQKPDEGSFLTVGTQGYAEEGSLNFFEGAYYLRLQVYPDDEAGKKGVRRCAEVIAGKIVSTEGFPSIFDRFPREGLVENSFGYEPSGVLGTKGLPGAYTAGYRLGERNVTLYLIRGDDPGAAGRALSLLRKSVEKRGAEPIGTAPEGAEGFVARDRYYGLLTALRSGENVVVVKGAEEKGWAEKKALELLGGLSESGR